jgi:hypothetical protein
MAAAAQQDAARTAASSKLRKSALAADFNIIDPPCMY